MRIDVPDFVVVVCGCVIDYVPSTNQIPAVFHY